MRQTWFWPFPQAFAGSTGKLALAQDPVSIAKYGIFEDSLSVSDATISDRVLLGYAGAELAFRAFPYTIVSIVPFPWDGAPGGSVPRFLVDYNIGDICYLVADHELVKIGLTGSPHPIRIFGVGISIDNEGNERIESLQTVAS